MPDRFCPNCGTEVEADARFCPTCGTTLSQDAVDQIPAAPAWPPADDDVPEPVPASDGWEQQPIDEPTAAVSEPPPSLAPSPAPQPSPAPSPEREPEPGLPAVAPPPPPASAPISAAADGPERSAEMPFSWPTLLSGWLIGGGAVVGALALIPRLAGAGYLVSMLLFLALLGIAATIFLADHVPDIPRLRLIVLCTTLIGLGVGLARAAFAIQGIDTLFLVAMLAAAGGALLVELERDRPFPPPERSGS